MDEIAKSAAEISRIIGVIDKIAFQTSLLALSAGVEAARAGEAGRGFAIVAAEVRSLAQRSAEAAKEIKLLVTASTGRVDVGVKLVADTGRALEGIQTRVAEINGVVADIATGAREQAAGLDHVNSVIAQMDQKTQRDAAMAADSNAASQTLAEETRRLYAMIGKFQIGGDARGAAPPELIRRRA
jgi:methyl-accepting chemotaxis protein